MAGTAVRPFVESNIEDRDEDEHNKTVYDLEERTGDLRSWLLQISTSLERGAGPSHTLYSTKQSSQRRGGVGTGKIGGLHSQYSRY